MWLKLQLAQFLPVYKSQIENLYLEVTNRCNGNCVFCSHHLSRRKQEDMDLDLLEQLLIRVRPKLLLPQVFGEPLLYPYIVDAISYASYLKIRSMIVTNGQFLFPQTFINLSNAGLDRLVISFGATTKEVYESIWRECNYETVCENIINTYELKTKHDLDIKITIRPIITKENRHQLDDIRKTWKPYCDSMEIVNEFHLYKYDRIQLKKLNRPNCKQSKKLLRECVIKSNGDVVLCCVDSDGDFIIGNAYEDDIMNIWNSPTYNEYRNKIYSRKKDLLPPICLECPICPI